MLASIIIRNISPQRCSSQALCSCQEQRGTYLPVGLREHSHDGQSNQLQIVRIGFSMQIGLAHASRHDDIIITTSIEFIRYLTEMQGKEQKGRWWSNAKQWVQKQYFNAAHTLDLGLNDDKSSVVTIFGHQLKSNKEAKIIYSSILWFTYREALYFPGSPLTSDVGWGCMLRVGQMALAEALRRTKGIENYGNPDIVNGVINQFVDKKQRFTVQNMVKKGEQMFRKGAGSWFTPSETAHILKQLQNQDTISPLRVMVFNNELQISSALQYLKESNREKRKEVTQSYIKKNKNKIVYDSKMSIYPGLIIVLIRIGMTSPQPDMLQSLVHIMKVPSFMGILGGKPGLAHYIVGSTAKSFIYLDPHCVKEHKETEQFLNESMFSMPQQKVDTSMGVCFFVEDYAALMKLYDQLGKMKNQTFYSHSIIEPPKLTQIIAPDHFQILGDEM